MYGVGSVGIAPITTCPHCSKLVEGSCVICTPNDPHPSCLYCEEGRINLPWHRKEIVVGIASAVVISVASGILIAWFNAKRAKRKRRN